MAKLPPPLVVLTPGVLDDDAAGGGALAGLVAEIGALLAAGVRGILVREPRLGDGALGALLGLLRERIERDAPDTWLGLHDRVHLTAGQRVDAVHVGFRSLAPAEVRELVPPSIAIGLSTHAGDDPASWLPADYLFHGPVQATASKEGWLEPIGVAGLARAVEATPRPIWALGGVEAAHAAELAAAGAAGLAVLSGVRAAGGAVDLGRARALVEAAAAAFAPVAPDSTDVESARVAREER